MNVLLSGDLSPSSFFALSLSRLCPFFSPSSLFLALLANVAEKLRKGHTNKQDSSRAMTLLWLVSPLALVVTATFTVYWSAVVSNSKSSLNALILAEVEQPELHYWEIVLIPLTSSMTLLVLYFFFSYIQYGLGRTLVHHTRSNLLARKLTPHPHFPYFPSDFHRNLSDSMPSSSVDAGLFLCSFQVLHQRK